VQNGFMTLTKEITNEDKDGGGLFQYVDWKKTSAYALGFGSIYLNIKGREKNGIVGDGPEADSVSNDIIEKFTKLTDPKDGQRAVRNVYKNKDIYSGEQAVHAPDLIVGFEDGFRTSWQTAIGGAPPELMGDNLKKWTGDHIIDPSVVPGILLTNFAINREPGLMDIAPTVLSCFGMTVEGMDGKTLI